MDLKKSKILPFPKWVSPWFLSKVENFVPVQFFSKIVRNKVFCDLLDRKLANLDQKNIDFKKQNIGIFPKGLVSGFWSKIGKFVPVQFFSKQSKTKCFVTLQIEIQPFKTKKHGFRKGENFAFFKGVSLWFLVKIRKVCSCFVFQQNTPKQSVL